jgi:GT2 family glycosyltransferase
MIKKMKISVVIPTYNSWKTLKLCIDSIKNQTLKPGEILVVDNNSSDETATKVKKYFPEVKLIIMKSNTGVTGGRNAGIKLANKNSDYLFFFDHDMYAHPHMLEELAAVAESGENIGIVTPKIYYYKDKKRIWAAGTGINLWTGQVLFRGGKDIGQFEKVEEVQIAPAAMLIKKSVIKKIKEFDMRYFATYEDTDFCFRAKKIGFTVYYSPKAIAYHDLPIDFRQESVRLLSRSYWVGRNRVIFMKDFGKNFLVFLVFLPIYFLYYLKLALKFNNLNAWKEFIKGTVAGLFS